MKTINADNAPTYNADLETGGYIQRNRSTTKYKHVQIRVNGPYRNHIVLGYYKPVKEVPKEGEYKVEVLRNREGGNSLLSKEGETYILDGDELYLVERVEG